MLNQSVITQHLEDKQLFSQTLAPLKTSAEQRGGVVVKDYKIRLFAGFKIADQIVKIQGAGSAESGEIE